MFQPVAALVQSADLAICHLEVPLAPPGKPVTGYPLFGAPTALVPAIKTTGWDRCSTASNHSIDQGVAGIDTTLNALDTNGLSHAGSSRTQMEANANEIFEVNGIRVAHHSYAYGLNGLRLPKDQPWRVNIIRAQTIIDDARKAREAGAELVLVSLHWGQEYQSAPTKEQERIAEAVTASGQVDAIIGHHAHVVQPIRLINNHWVVFGLGNHLSGQIGGRKRTPAVQDGLMVTMTFGEQPDHHFTAQRPIGHATWVHPTNRKVYLVAQELAKIDLPIGLRRAIAPSRTRTARVVGEFLK
jgi:poly-gamma-glutamate capsule biosynthesis protein CapA/YwtB (metallophosphatase superfamily)